MDAGHVDCEPTAVRKSVGRTLDRFGAEQPQHNKKGANILVLHKWIKFIVELCTWVLKKISDGPLVWLNGILTSTAINLIQIF